MISTARASVPAEVQKELYSLFTRPDASFQRMVDIAAEKRMTLTVDEEGLPQADG